MTEQIAGLEHRYNVERVNDPNGKHAGCRYFVLDPQHDQIARVALMAYSNVARGRGLVALADDLQRLVKDCGGTNT
jgi:hypothetical protein